MSEIGASDATEKKKLNPCNIKGIKKTKKETAHCFLAVVENQAKSGANCSPGTDLNMGEKIVNTYAKVGFFYQSTFHTQYCSFLAPPIFVYSNMK